MLQRSWSLLWRCLNIVDFHRVKVYELGRVVARAGNIFVDSINYRNPGYHRRSHDDLKFVMSRNNRLKDLSELVEEEEGNS